MQSCLPVRAQKTCIHACKICADVSVIVGACARALNPCHGGAHAATHVAHVAYVVYVFCLRNASALSAHDFALVASMGPMSFF